MVKLILTRGVPASGKSTWAKAWVAEAPEARLRVNRDNLRWTLGIKTGVGTREQENEVTHWQNEMIVRALKAGKDVVVDNTNLRAANVKELMRLGLKHGAEIEFKDFAVTREQAIERDFIRGDKGYRSVGEIVISTFFSKFVGKNGELPKIPVLHEQDAVGHDFKPYVPGHIKAVSFDIDGTLADMGDRRGPYDTSRYHLDTVHEGVREVLWRLQEAGYEVLILSGRSDEFKTVLVDWLDFYQIYPADIFMRAKGDERNDAIIKSELVDEHISGVYDVIMHFDDRNRVVDALRAKGMKVAQVEPGDF